MSNAQASPIIKSLLENRLFKTGKSAMDRYRDFSWILFLKQAQQAACVSRH